MSNSKGPEFQGQLVCSCLVSTGAWLNLAGGGVSALKTRQFSFTVTAKNKMTGHCNASNARRIECRELY